MARLLELLGEEHESEALDFKSDCDIRERPALLELVRDMAAMAAEGGYLIVGAADSGRVIGLSPSTAGLFDEANLRGQVRRFLPDVDIRSAVHDVHGHLVAAVHAAQHPDGYAIFATDGQYRDPAGRDVTVFRQGEVLIRRGTASVRPDYLDMQRLRHRFAERVRADVRLQWAREVAGVEPALRPNELSWDLDPNEFVKRAVDLTRAGDRIGVRLVLSQARATAAAWIADDDTTALGNGLDAITCLAAVADSLEADWLCNEALDALTEVYEAGHLQARRAPSVGTEAAKVWLEVAARILALGGLGVRRSHWATVRSLALRPGEPSEPTSLRRTWIRHALVMAARAGLLQEDRNGALVEVSIISLAQAHAARLDCLHPDLSGSDEVLNSLCQFDALACLAVIAEGRRTQNAYPSFGVFHEYRVEPALARMIQDAEMRTVVAPMSDSQLADALRYLDFSARQQFFMNWDGYVDRRILDFLDAHQHMKD
jgi:hypothetical protein